MQPLLLELWREQHPKGHEQTMLDYIVKTPEARRVPLSHQIHEGSDESGARRPNVGRLLRALHRPGWANAHWTFLFLALADVRGRDRYTIPQLDCLDTQPCRPYVFSLNGKLANERLAGKDDVFAFFQQANRLISRKELAHPATD
jgi:hypothetical protein